MKTVSTSQKKPFPLAGMKDFVEKYFFARRKKKSITGRNLSKMKKKWFPLARKSVVHLQE